MNRIFRRLYSKEAIRVVFKSGDGERTVFGKAGQDLMRLAHENDIDLEGACEGSLACSTCHVILESQIYNKLSEPTDEENDMLDLAFGLTKTQVKLDESLDGMLVTIPSATRNMAVDGFRPKPH